MWAELPRNSNVMESERKDGRFYGENYEENADLKGKMEKAGE